MFGSKDRVAEKLFPPPPPPPFTTKPGFAVPISQRRVYDSGAAGNCKVCQKPRVFECQLMPNLINILRNQKPKNQESGPASPKTEADRKRELLDIGMEWGTCLLFSCAEDCGGGDNEYWREELVLVQWDD